MSVSGLGRIAMADKMSVDQLREALQNRTLPAYIAVPLIEEKLDMNKRMQAMAAMQQAQQKPPPIAEQVMQRAATEGGIESLPTRLAPAEGMAGGGIVAFEDGGYVSEPIRFQNTGLVPNVPNATNFVGSLGGGNTPDPKVLRAYYLSKGLPLPEELKTPAERAASSNAPRGPASSMAELIGVDRLTAPSGRMNEPSLISQFMQRKKAEAMGGAPSAENPQGIAAAVPPSAATSQVAASNIPPDQEGGAIGIPAAAPKEMPSPSPAKTDGGIDSILASLRGANTEYEKTVRGLQGQTPTKESAIADVKAFDEAFGVNRDYYKNQLEDLKKEKEDLKLDRETAANLRLLEAGLNIMAGESPHALVNIGKGASKALLGFAGDVKDIKKQSRDLDKARRDLETAEQAVARSDSVKAQDRFQRAQELYQARELDLAKSKMSLAEKLATVKVQGMQVNKPPGDMQIIERYAKDPEFRKAYDRMQVAKQTPKDRTTAMKEWSDNILLQKQFPKFDDYFASIGGSTGLPSGVVRQSIR